MIEWRFMESMQLLLIVILGASLVINGVVLWIVLRRGSKEEGAEGALLIQGQLQDLARTLDSRLGETSKNMHEAVRQQFGDSARLMNNINEQVRQSLMDVAKEQLKTNEATQQFVTIAAQLSNLEKVLKNQKQRGNLGEASLELVMSNILPPTSYKMQYAFPNGETVDAAIFTKEGVIPVDAKFPLENYSRIHDEKDDVRRVEYEEAFKKDLKKRIDETGKYVRPQDGTLPFAFMYIPAEGIYYDLLNDGVGAVNTRNLIDYAQNERKVIIVSPTTFAAYLQSVLYGFKAFKIEERAIDIIKNVDLLGRHLHAYNEYFLKMGNALSTTVNHWTAASKELKKVDRDILKITGEAPQFETLAIDRPVKED